ncbi:MAG: AAA family ATPase [Prevotellaceae bacterium]|jgi:predicted ATPase|nr:AAA family ATPase [Prevotellaceae bacterium]
MDGKYINRVTLYKKIEEESYLTGLPVVEYLTKNKCITFDHDVTFFVGENGTGKSTLIEAIAVAYGFNAEGGSKNFNFTTSRTHSNLYEYLRLAKNKYPKDGFFFRAESYYNFATNMDELDKEGGGPPIKNSYGGISLHNQSHGESFLALIQNRLSGNGLYIFDEPEAALSPSKLLVLLIEMNSLVKNNSQFIIATHSPILMAFPGSKVLEFSENGIEKVPYKDTRHFEITKLFINNPERMLEKILEEK